ncbi:MAG TPA: DUF6491 family protein [Lysobacter sp.]
MAGDDMRKALPSLILVAALAACSHGPTLTVQERLALYREHAGAPIGSFRLDRMTGMQRWTPLGDQALAVWSSANRGNLLEMRTRCPGLTSAARISITNSLGQVTTMDRVVTRSAAGTVMGSCRIASIRPLDGQALRDAKRELRDADIIERSAAPPEDPAAPSG